MFEDYEEEKQEIDINVLRLQREPGTHAIIRFRCLEDLIAFADLLEEPAIKTVKKGSQVKFKWSADKHKRDPLSQFME